MGKDSQTTGKRRSPAVYLWAAALAAIVGFAAVYWTNGPSDNVSGDLSVQSGPTTEAKTGGEAQKLATEARTAAAVATGKLNSGHMANFVFKPEPEPVPELSFKDGTGADKTLADFKGKTVLLNIWATWCGPCREEMPALDRLQEQLGGDKFEVIALSVDRGGAQKSQEFLDQIKVKNLRLYTDESSKVTAPLKVIGMPTTLLIDSERREVGRLVGPAEWDSEDAVRLVKAQIK